MNRLLPLFLLSLVALMVLPALPLHAQSGGAGTGNGAGSGVRKTIPVRLDHGSFNVHDLPPSGMTPAPAVILLFTGKGGWTLWEDRVGGHLAKLGYYVLGIDTPRYASAKGDDYIPDDYAADIERIVEAAPDVFVARNAPVILVGRGLGAAAAIGGAAVPPPPPRLAGLIVTDVPERGRYGFHLRDRVPFLSPGGEGTFTMSEAAKKFGTGPAAIAVAQIHPDDGYFDTTAWLADVQGAKKRFDYVRGWKNFGVATPAFVKALDEALAWQIALRTPPAPAPKVEEAGVVAPAMP